MLKPRTVNPWGPGCPAFTLVELMIGMTVMSIGLLAVAGMFQTGWTDVAKGGKATIAANAARQTLEDLRSIPFNDLVSLYTNGAACNPPVPCLGPYTFNTNNVATLRGNQTVRDVLRQLRYTLRGDDGTGGWNFTQDEKNRWATMLSTGGAAVGATATVTIADATQGANRVLALMDITVTVTVPGSSLNVQVGTRINRT
jgi:prepilin-type N-terminal cleavage/methylation domain-containing protein